MVVSKSPLRISSDHEGGMESTVFCLSETSVISKRSRDSANNTFACAGEAVLDADVDAAFASLSSLFVHCRRIFELHNQRGKHGEGDLPDGSRTTP